MLYKPIKIIKIEKTQKLDIEKLYREFLNDFNRNKKEMSFKFKSLGNELDSSTKNSHWGGFGIFWNLIKFFLK